MVKAPGTKAPKWAAPAVAAAAVTVSAYLWLSGGASGPATPVRAGSRTRPAAAVSPLPVIGYDRLVADRPVDPGLGRRDLFDYPAPPPTPTPEPTPEVVETPPPVTVPTPTPEPPLNIKYIGAVERKGVKVAMLLTDKKEVLTGQVGEVVGNRFKIVKIGLESLDIQEVGSGSVRRIPLKGN